MAPIFQAPHEGFLKLGDEGEVNRERGSVPARTFDGDATSLLLGEGMGDGQAQASPRLLGDMGGPA